MIQSILQTRMGSYFKIGDEVVNLKASFTLNHFGNLCSHCGYILKKIMGKLNPKSLHLLIGDTMNDDEKT
jgi:hypothetical protein